MKIFCQSNCFFGRSWNSFNERTCPKQLPIMNLIKVLHSIKNLGIPGNFFESSFESASKIKLFKFDVCTFEWFQKSYFIKF